MKFIDWAIKDLEREDTYKAFFEKAHDLLIEWENKPKNEVIEAVYNKLEKARSEYGEPDKKKSYDFDKELGMEIIDLVFGWPLVDKFLKENGT